MFDSFDVGGNVRLPETSAREGGREWREGGSGGREWREGGRGGMERGEGWREGKR